MAAIEWHEDAWRLFPESYTQEPLLRGRTIVYRYCRIMKRFKIIYHYDKTKDVVHIVDLWDTLQNPATLIQRIE